MSWFHRAEMSPDGTMTRAEQFAMIGKAKKRTLAWARESGLALVNIEHVVPFVETDFSLSVWLFYDLDLTAKAASANGMTERVSDKYRSVLRELGYPGRWLAEVDFIADSHETVVRDYEGSYFLRLR